MALPKGIADFLTTLASGISSTATSLTLADSTDSDGNTLSGAYILTLNDGNSKEEHMLVSCTGASCTITTRGLQRNDMETNVPANQFEHRRGDSVKITSACVIPVIRSLNGDIAFDNVDWTGVNSVAGLATPTSGETTKAANVAYVNAVAVAGASDMTTTVKGIAEKATDAELQSGAADGSGDTSAPLVATSTSFSETAAANKVPVADSSGKLDIDWLNLPLTTEGDILYRDGSGLARLGIGTAGQKFRVNSAGSSPEWFTETQTSNVLSVDGTAITNNFTTSEIDLFSETITGGTLGTGNIIRVIISFDSLVVNSASSVIFKLYYGATELASYTLSGDTVSLHGELNVYIFGNGATNAQFAKLSGSFLGPGFESGTGVQAGAFLRVGTSTEDSTQNLSLRCTGRITDTGSGSGSSFRVRSHIAYIIN